MTAFNVTLDTELPDCVFVEVDDRFKLAVERTDSCLSIRVYPRTNGELWEYPFTVFEVEEAEIIELEKEF